MVKLVLAVLLACVAAVTAMDCTDGKWYNIGNRQYFICNPNQPGTKLPILLYYNGYGQVCNGGMVADMTFYAIKIGFPVIIGAVCAVNGQWDLNGGSSGDISFTRSVLSDMSKRFDVDTSKVFVSGWSMGGMFVSMMACNTGDSIVMGFAMNSCGSTCNGISAPVHVLGFDGFYDSVCRNSVVNSYNSFAKLEGCPTSTDNNAHQTCKGKYLDLHQWPAPHMFMGPHVHVNFFMKILGLNAPADCTVAPPADAHGGASFCNIAGQDSCGINCDAGFWQSTTDGNEYCWDGKWAGNLPTLPVPTCVLNTTARVDTTQKIPHQDAVTVPTCAVAIEGSSASLSCPAGQIITQVKFSSYGTATGDCASSFAVSSTCNAGNSTSLVQSACIGRNACTVQATNALFGDPCFGTQKHLSVSVSCGAPLNTAVTCGTAGESSTLALGCVAGQTIKSVSFASYGLPSGDCVNPTTSSTCNAANSLSIVQGICVGNNQCSVAATNDVFGDPCVGTGKKLQAAITCA